MRDLVQPLRLLVAAAATAFLFAPVQAAEDAPGGELRVHWVERAATTQGPLAAADALVPGLAGTAPSALVAEAELRHTLRTRMAGAPLSLTANLLAWHEQPEGGAARSRGRVNELYAATDLGAWSLSAGKKVLGWDVGYGFRPNDVVQQEARRSLLATTPEGRPLLQAEHFGSDSAATLVWVNPPHLNDPADTTRGAQESALAARWYRRDGPIDWHAFGRVGKRTRTSAGAALAWVAGDDMELHASWRALQRHDGWRIDSTAAERPVAVNPWQMATRGGASQWLLGLNWTGAQQQSVLVEAWHDGTALPDPAWRAWTARNRALAGPHAMSPAAPAAFAGNLAWQASPLNSPSLRRDNLFVRLAWQPEHWRLSLDALVMPADRGRIVTATVQWQGDRLRLNASWRSYGGPAEAVIAQLPLRHAALLGATWAF